MPRIGAFTKAFIALLSVVGFTSGVASAKDVSCAQRVFNPTDAGILQPLHATAAGSEFHLTYIFHGSRADADYLRFASISIDDVPLAEYSVSTVPDAMQSISLYSLKPGSHRIYIEFMIDPKLRGKALTAIETCVRVPASQQIDTWEGVP